jgi:hypothetical protein
MVVPGLTKPFLRGEPEIEDRIKENREGIEREREREDYNTSKNCVRLTIAYSYNSL